MTDDMSRRGVENVDTRPKHVEPQQNDEVEAAHFQRRIRAYLSRPTFSLPPLMTAADVQAAEECGALPGW
ncbi:hypothetical protein [Streptomyces sp. TLI_105]|uniref:hypothetical protein n=1 Tax=Streptomyces sp. TLI_105 TaxID=1881019 RepID=UPI00115F9455|nr:hypothetical protein [Streptomyces sp. TLI_105]